jgi:hypothetical protein
VNTNKYQKENKKMAIEKNQGREQYKGERPVTWVEAREPMFRELSLMYKSATDNEARPHGSKYGNGVGFFFPTEMVDRYQRTRMA